jgi:fatty-acyl-CoA synthase
VTGLSDALTALTILQRRRMVDLRRPLDVLAANRDIRRYGAFGGLATHAARRYGDAPALTDELGTLSFRELDNVSNAVGRGLRSEGIGTGSTIGLLNRGHRGLVLAIMAANKIGARAVLLNTGFAGPQLADVCRREKIAQVLADDEFDAVLEALPSGTVRGRSADELALGMSCASLPIPRSPGGLVLLTSGTTGTPKGAPRNKINPLQSAQVLDRIPLPSRSAIYVAAPLFHATGLALASLGLALGNRVILTRRFDPEATLATIAKYRVGALILVPTMLQRLLDLPDAILRRYDASSLSVLFAAGSALSPDLCRRTAEAFGDVLYNLYGSTEVAVAAVATPDDLRAAPGTVGRSPVGCNLAVYDDQRRRITTPGEVGTLFVKSGLSFTGYTDGGHKEIVEGRLSTGDTGHFDDDGLWFVDGRDDDMIVSGGENVFPLEVENLLSSHPQVVEAAVIGVDDAEFGKRLRAYVVGVSGHSLQVDAIQAYVKAHLARHKVPRDVLFLDALPRNETGKVLKGQLARD